MSILGFRNGKKKEEKQKRDSNLETGSTLEREREREPYF